MKRILIIVVILIVGGGIYYYLSDSKKQEEIKYQSIRVESREVKDFVEVTGQIEPLNRVEIVPPVSGRIEKIFVEEGTNVESGEVLCLMSASDRVAILDAARSVSEEEYKKWQDAYKPIKVLAPIAGRIILRNIVEGQTVGAGSVIFAMSDRLIATASVDESDIGKIKKGQTAYITLDAYPDVNLTGRVFQILDEGKNVSNVIIYKVKISLDRIPDFIKSQMTADIKILILKKKILAIPSRAIELSKDGKAYVIAGFDSKKNPIKKEVKVGKDYDEFTEIKEGLSENEELFMKVIKYSKQSVKQGSNPFMPQRKKSQPQGVIRRI